MPARRKLISVRVAVPHDGLARNTVVELADTDDVRERIRRRYLIPVEEDIWQTKSSPPRA